MIEMTLKELRKSKGLTQTAAAEYLGIAPRTYQNYESDISKQKGIKFEYIFEKLLKYGYVDENNGILSIEKIQEVCLKVFSEFKVSYCYLFGSYAKGKATAESDVDLFISTDIDGLRFFELVEVLREGLKKKVDLLDQRQLENNFELTNEILKDGIKIYG